MQENKSSCHNSVTAAVSNVQTTSQALTEAESQSTASHLFARTRSFHRPTFIRPGTTCKMRCFFFYTDLGQILLFFALFLKTCTSAVFHNFARQIALIHYSGRSKHALPLHNKSQNWLHYKTFSWRLFSKNNLLLYGM